MVSILGQRVKAVWLVWKFYPEKGKEHCWHKQGFSKHLLSQCDHWPTPHQYCSRQSFRPIPSIHASGNLGSRAQQSVLMNFSKQSSWCPLKFCKSLLRWRRVLEALVCVWVTWGWCQRANPSSGSLEQQASPDSAFLMCSLGSHTPVQLPLRSKCLNLLLCSFWEIKGLVSCSLVAKKSVVLDKRPKIISSETELWPSPWAVFHVKASHGYLAWQS